MSESDSDQSGPSIDSLDVQFIQTAGQGIEQLLKREQNVRRTFGDLYARKISDEPVQPAINTFFQDTDGEGVYLTFQLANDFGIESLATACVEEEVISPDQREAVLDLWDELKWAEPAAKAYRQQQSGTKFWTNRRSEFAGKTNNGELRMSLTAKHGVDQLWDIQLPLTQLVQRSDIDLRMAESALNELPDSVTITDDEVTRLQDLVNNLQETVDALSAAVDNMGDGDVDDSDYDEFI
ncbi:hypothetical protein ACOJIV_18210 [Haloarcula sp. AONF1]